MNDGLDNRLAEAERRIADLRRERGIARLDGAAFDETKLAAAEREAAALADARSEDNARQRQRQAEERARYLTALGGLLARQEGERLAAVHRAEAGARELVGGINDALSVAAEMRETIVQMDTPVPLGLAEGAFADRLSQRLSSVLATIERHPARFGQVAWRTSWRPAAEDWRKSERGELADDIRPLSGDDSLSTNRGAPA